MVKVSIIGKTDLNILDNFKMDFEMDTEFCKHKILFIKVYNLIV
jgi:hypothetical protein